MTALVIRGLPFLTVGGVGDVIQLTATAMMSDGTQTIPSDVQWNIVATDPIATVSSGGLLTLVHVGSAQVRASSAGLTASQPIFAMPQPVPITNGVTEHIQGHNVCTERPFDPLIWNGHGRTMTRVTVHSDGIADLVGGRDPFDIGGGTAIYRLSANGEVIWAPFSNHAVGGHRFDVQAGYDYVLVMLGDVELCPYDYDIIFQHPK